MGITITAETLPPIAALSGRKAQVLAFVCEHILTHGTSPSMPQIAMMFGFSRQRAKAIVDALAKEGRIHRAPGSQRAISVPGLQRQQLIDALRRHGVKVDDDFNLYDSAYPLPQGNLSLVAIIEHVPDDDRSQSAPEAR